MHLELMALRRAGKPLPEGGPLDDPKFDLPEPQERHLSDDQIHQRIHDVLTGAARWAFTHNQHYWREMVTTWEEEHIDMVDASCAICDDGSRDRRHHVETMMYAHARELLGEMNEEQLMDEGIQP